jgi:hypothetical protein
MQLKSWGNLAKPVNAAVNRITRNLTLTGWTGYAG